MHGIKALWLRVLHQSLIDCVNPKPVKYPKLKEGLQNEAKEFLFGKDKEGRELICAAAGVSLLYFEERAKFVFDNRIELKDEENILSKIVDPENDPDYL